MSGPTPPPEVVEGTNTIDLGRLTMAVDSMGDNATVTLDGKDITRAVRSVTISAKPGQVTATIDIAADYLNVNQPEGTQP